MHAALLPLVSATRSAAVPCGIANQVRLSLCMAKAIHLYIYLYIHHITKTAGKQGRHRRRLQRTCTDRQTIHPQTPNLHTPPPIIPNSKQVLETRLLFLSAHLAAGHTQVKLRTQDFARIATGVLKYVRRGIRMCRLCVLYVCPRRIIHQTITDPTNTGPSAPFTPPPRLPTAHPPPSAPSSITPPLLPLSPHYRPSSLSHPPTRPTPPTQTWGPARARRRRRCLGCMITSAGWGT